MNEKIKSYKRKILILLSLAIIIVSLIISINIIKPKEKYQEAIQLFEENNLKEANAIFKELGDYKESEKYLENINEEINSQRYKEAYNFYVEGNFDEAEELFSQITLETYKGTERYLENIVQLKKYTGTWSEIGGDGNWLIFDKWTVYEVVNPNNFFQTIFDDKYNLDDSKDHIKVTFPAAVIKYYINENGQLTKERIHKNPNENTVQTFKKINESTALPAGIKEPQIGMTAEEVKKSTWGEPEKINKTTTKYGVSEQWVYYGYKYIYLENGIVTAIQE